MRIPIRMLQALVALASTPAVALADTQDAASTGGVSAVWIFANLSYTAMRAQGSASAGWRIIAFIFGFPGTLLTYLLVDEGSEKAYGIEMPRKPASSA
ncbi:MAG: hypothetical protein OEW77_04100 [Gemmatimonadota bacterium]|nr:hypothetical protein [Gemmatimonadota bacterium]